MKSLSAFALGVLSQAVGIGVGLLMSSVGVPYSLFLSGFVTLILVGIILFQALHVCQPFSLFKVLPFWAFAHAVFLHAAGFIWCHDLVKGLVPFSMAQLRVASYIFALTFIVFACELALVNLFVRVRAR